MTKKRRVESDELNEVRWRGLCRSLDFPADHPTFAALREAYSEAHRAYHTARHVNECLAWLDAARERIDRADLVEVAVWFHDAIHRPGSNENEAASAQWALDWMQMHAAGYADAVIVESAITATRHDRPPESDIEKWLADIDLAILGASPGRFHEYEHQVRQEYGGISDLHFNRRRTELLRAFLLRPSIYSTEFFQERLEGIARDNLRRAVRRLGG